MTFMKSSWEAIVEDYEDQVIRYIFIVPGLSKKDIDIDFFSSDEIIIKGKNTKYSQEFEVKKFVPNNTKPEDIKANLSNGILEIVVNMPKKTKIKINQ